MTHCPRLVSLAVVLVAAVAGCSSGEPETEVTAGEVSSQVANVDWQVNGYTLTEQEQEVVGIIARDVVPHLEGDREVRLKTASRGAWWALKEGTWARSLERIYRYNNCNSAAGDRLIQPTEVCGSGRAWQVGLGAVQVPGHTTAEVDALAAKLYPEVSTQQLLGEVTVKGGLTQEDARTVVESTGPLHVSWMLRVPAIGITVVAKQEVVPECIEGSLRWCYGSSWDETRRYAPNKEAAFTAILDLRRILRALAP